MRNVIAILILGIMLAGCATATGKVDSDCKAHEITILNEDTGRYDCVDEAEYEKILDELDEVRW
jgi:PBP1b-binding outer membrane lipoprotein LpoB